MPTNYLIFTHSLDLNDRQNHSPNMEINFKMSVSDFAWAMDLALESVLSDKQLAQIYEFTGTSFKLIYSTWRNRYHGVSAQTANETVQLNLAGAIKLCQIRWIDIDAKFYDLSKLNLFGCSQCDGYGGWGRGGDDHHECPVCGGMGYTEEINQTSE